MKKLMLAFWGFLVFVGLFSSTAFAASTLQSGKCGDAVTWRLDTDGLLTISGTGAMKDYELYSDVPWYSRRAQITAVTVDSGVTAIGDLAFNLLEELTTASIADSVTSLGDHAFGSCKKLAAVDIPDGVTTIGIGAFYDCDSLASIDIPHGVKVIQDETFFSCNALTSVSIPDSVTSIDEDAFLLCNALTTVTIPDSVTYIGQSAFQQCTKLRSVTFGKKVSSISYCAFYYCGNLRTIVFTGNAPTIKSDSFKNINAVAYYPPADATWTDAVKTNYGGALTWMPWTCKELGMAHTVVETEAVLPTCTEPGLTAGSSCSVCGQTIVEQEVLPAAGHTYAEAAFVWAADLTAAAASASCHCGHEETVPCTFQWSSSTGPEGTSFTVTASAALGETTYRDVREITAVQSGQTILITLPNEIPGLQIIAAAYSSAGQMTECQFARTQGSTASLSEIAGHDVRFYFLTRDLRPIMPCDRLFQETP